MDYTQKLYAFFEKHKRMPSYQEATVVLGVRSKDSAYRIIGKLIKAHVVKKDAQGKLIPVRTIDGTVKLLGLIEAGFPTPAEENLLEEVTLDSFMIEHPERSFMLRVKGNSMIDAGIREGDFVIVERGVEPKPGQIVVAEVDGSWTMKYLRKKGTQLYLEAANTAYQDIIPHESLSIAAVVTGVVRKYG